MKCTTVLKTIRVIGVLGLFSTALLSTSTNVFAATELDSISKIENNTSSQANTQDQTDLQNSAEDKNLRASIGDADTNITTLMLKVNDSLSGKETEYAYTPAVNASDPYEGGELTFHAKVPLQGNVYNRDLFPTHASEHIENFHKGNYGARVNLTFPEGTNARSMFRAIDWEKTQTASSCEFYFTVLSIPTPIQLQWGMTWDRSSVLFDNNRPNEFSLVLRGINKDEVSTSEWESYNPAATETALTAAGVIPGGGVLGNMNGWAQGAIFFDISKYEGNTDDLSVDKVITKGRLMPALKRKSSIDISVLDMNSLLAGTEGQGNISKAIIKTGHEHDNTQTSNTIETWADYLSIYDSENIYNTNTMEENELPTINNALPGLNTFNRDLVVNAGDDFNTMAPNRFNRVINYFSKQDVTNGLIGDVDSIEVTHTPSKVPDGKKTAVTYSGTVHYFDGSSRQLPHNILNVTNHSANPETGGTITGINNYSLSSNDGFIHGTYSGTKASQVKVSIDGVMGVTVPLVPGNGAFQYYIADQVNTVSQQVTVYLLDASGNTLDTKNLTIIQ